MFGLEFLLPMLLGGALGAGASMLMSHEAPDYSAQIAASERANQAALDALASSEERLKKAQEAMIPAADNESARLAAERRARRLKMTPSTLFGGDDDLGAPNVAFRTLMGVP